MIENDRFNCDGDWVLDKNKIFANLSSLDWGYFGLYNLFVSE